MFKLILFSFIASLSLFSQRIFNEEIIGCGKYNTYKSLKNLEYLEAKNYPKRNYDIQEITLNADWRNPLSSEGVSLESRTWTANETIKIKIDSANTNEIKFDLKNIRVDSLKINGLSSNSYSISNVLTIEFAKNLEVGEELEIEIDYTYIGTDNIGFVLVDTSKAPERLAYTMSQPNDAKNWIICNDNPYDKQMFKLNLRVPRGFVGASNGIIKELVENQNFTEYKWEHPYPIPSYLMVINASKFKRFDLKAPRVENPLDSILLDNYIWAKDYTKSDEDDSPYFADKTLDILPEMLVYLQSLFGKYPFEKFGTVTVENFWAAGMEHQSIQTIRRSLLNGDDPVLIHELSHMWLGDMVTPTSWRDIWMSEGGAQWSEALWEGYVLKDEDAYQNKMVDIKRYFLNLSGPFTIEPIYLYDIESTVFGGNRWFIIYQKASWIYHQLMNFIGKEEFYKILNEYFEEYAYQSIDGEQFISFFEARATNPSMPIRKFFDQFLYAAGHPLIDFKYEIKQNENNYKIDISLEQIQNKITKKHPKCLDLYEFPFIINFYKDNQIAYKDTITMNEIKYENTYNLDFQPDSLNIDENFSFFQLSNIISSISTKAIEKSFTISPMPVDVSQDFHLSVNINKGSNYKIKLIDINGREIEELYSNFINAGNFTLNSKIKSSLSTGIYFIKVEGSEIFVKKIIVK